MVLYVTVTCTLTMPASGLAFKTNTLTPGLEIKTETTHLGLQIKIKSLHSTLSGGIVNDKLKTR